MKKIIFAIAAATLLHAPAFAQTRPAASITCDNFRSWEESQYFYMMRFASSDLDADADGIACEHLSRNASLPAITGGVSSASLGDYGYSIIQNRNGYYVRAFSRQGQHVFTTYPFSTRDAAQQYTRRYIPQGSATQQILRALIQN